VGTSEDLRIEKLLRGVLYPRKQLVKSAVILRER
jgi:hypothetical protein